MFGMPEMNNETLNEKLQRLVEIIDISAVLTDPLTQSIENFLRFSAAEMDSDEASVLIRDGNRGDLKFLTAIGQVAGSLLELKIPAGKGIAGFVMSSGQPMAIADVGAEESFYSEVDRQTGYSTQTILATPLRFQGEIIGVLEYINRRGQPPFASFTPEEMDRAAAFAETVAPLCNAYESAQILDRFCTQTVNAEKIDNYAEVRRWVAELRGSDEHKATMDLAVLLHEVASRGDAEKQLCREILEMVLRFSDSKSSENYLGL